MRGERCEGRCEEEEDVRGERCEEEEDVRGRKM